MIVYPYLSLPERFTRLLQSSIIITPNNNSNNYINLEIYLNDNKDINNLVKKVFKDIDPDGFVGKILSIAGWSGMRNRLAAVYIEYAMTGKFPETANLLLVADIVNIENKLRYFTPQGYARSFLLGFYAKMSLVYVKNSNDKKLPLIIKDEHLEFMKWSKAKSIRIDWLMLFLILCDNFFGTERLNSLLKSGVSYESLMGLLLPDEKKNLIENFMIYGSSINDQDMFIKDITLQL